MDDTLNNQGNIAKNTIRSDTTLLLLIGLLTVVWWASIWGLLDAFVSATKRPVFIYSILVLLIVSFFYKHPEIADRLL